MSNIPSVDEIFDSFEPYKNIEQCSMTEYRIPKIRIDDMKAALTRREERIKVEAKIEAFNAFKIQWANLLALGMYDDLTRWIAELNQQLKTLDGQENTNE